MHVPFDTINAMLPLAAGALHPIVILALCVIAGVGTLMLLPGKQEPSIRKLGGAIALAAFLIFMALLVRQSAAGGAGQVYFWLFSAIAIASGIRVITHVKPVYSALYFVLTVVASAGLFVLLWAEFMAAALILIYAGAILVTYVFVIMLAQQTQSVGTVTGGAEYDRVSREPLMASAVGFLLMGILLFVIFDKAPRLSAPAPISPADSSLKALAHYLFVQQLVATELAGLILTLAMVGAIIIARRIVAAERPMHGDVLAAAGPSGVVVEPEGTPTGTDDNPHSIPVYGTENPAAKAYPER
jgi:NADH-quinone oxidoreductase subunit J